jgi:hypothetical protein
MFRARSGEVIAEELIRRAELPRDLAERRCQAEFGLHRRLQRLASRCSVEMPAGCSGGGMQGTSRLFVVFRGQVQVFESRVTTTSSGLTPTRAQNVKNVSTLGALRPERQVQRVVTTRLRRQMQSHRCPRKSRHQATRG